MTDDTTAPPEDDQPRSIEVGEERRGSFEARIDGAASLFVVTDFDGTVAEIRPEPDAATIREDARAALERLTARPDVEVAVVSGRAADDVRNRVGLDGIACAGNHGMEIETPDRRFVHPEAEAASEVVGRVADEFRETLGDLEGLVVEDKGLTATIHYRQVDDSAAVERVRSAVETAADRHDALRASGGKQIVELRPDVDWDKGRAVTWLLETVTSEDDPHPIYLGDDVTDEAAFRAVAGSGTGVAVGRDPDETAAAYLVDDPAAVARLLAWLADGRNEA